MLQRALADFYVEYELRVWIESVEERVQVLSDLHQQIQDAFNEAGVQIMSPHDEGDPAGVVVVPPDKWYEAPARKPGDAGRPR